MDELRFLNFEYVKVPSDTKLMVHELMERFKILGPF